MSENKDILNSSKELKEMPFDVPEGYFQSFMENVRPDMERPAGLWERISPLLAMAAMFLAILTVGTTFMEKSYSDDGFTIEDYIVHSDLHESGEAYESYMTQIADAGITGEDIVEYLIYIGTPTESLITNIDE